jgi:hypothetical protein
MREIRLWRLQPMEKTMPKRLTPAQRRQINREAWALIEAIGWKSQAQRNEAYDRERQRLYALVLAGCDPTLNEEAAQ